MRRELSLICVVLTACARPSAPSSPTPPPAPPASMPTAIAIATNAASATAASATIRDVANTTIGSVTFTDSPAGLLVSGDVTGLGIGAHGIHLHSIGLCQTPGFSSAGPHFNPSGARHGFRNPAGHHAGDLPNLISPPAGIYKFQFIAAGVKLTGRGGMLDDDGASLVIHTNEDDHLTDPAGNSGGRFACGVIKLSK